MDGCDAVIAASHPSILSPYADYTSGWYFGS
jgi:hypothetical protein